MFWDALFRFGVSYFIWLDNLEKIRRTNGLATLPEDKKKSVASIVGKFLQVLQPVLSPL
jgi:hypothetical protein